MTHLTSVFAALGDPTRFAIVDRLLKEGELSAGDIADTAPISPPAFSRHLKLLREAGLLEQRTDKQRRIYSVRPEAVKQISVWVMDHRKFWESSLDRLEALIDEDNKKRVKPNDRSDY